MREDSVMVGYLNNEEANMTTFDRQGWMRHRLLPPGWLPLHRGQDQGADQSEGTPGKEQNISLSFLSFTTEIIQVAPAELEDVLRGLAGVLDVAVIGVESEREGEVPRAYIVREEELTEETVHSYMKEQVAQHKQLLGGIQFVENIPKSAAGKILRKDLKALYQAAV